MSQSINRDSNFALTSLLRAFQSLLNEHIKQQDHLEKIRKDKDFLQCISKADEKPVWVELNQPILKRLKKELEYKNIPYIQFDKANTNKGFLVFPAEYKELVQTIEKSVRIHSGLEIDTPQELEDILRLQFPDEKMFKIENVDQLVAARVLEMASAKNEKFPNLTIVQDEYTKEELKKLDYNTEKNINLYCMDKDSSLAQRLLIAATCDIYSQKKNTEAINKGLHYLNKEKLEIAAMIEELREAGSTENAFIYSMDNLDTFIKIEPTKFTVYKEDVEVLKMTKSQNPELYTDILKFLINEYNHPVYKLAEEVKHFNNGLDSEAIVNHIRQTELPEDIHPHDTYADREFKKWIENQYSDPIHQKIIISKQDIIPSIEDFVSFLENNKKEKALENVLEHKNYFEKQLQIVTEKLNNINTISKVPPKTIDDLIASAGGNSPEKALIEKQKQEIISFSKKNIITKIEEKETVYEGKQTLIKDNGIALEEKTVNTHSNNDRSSEVVR